MAVIVEPVLSEEKLRTLLAEQHEQSCLDYKEAVDLNERREIVEISKDIAAMQSERSGGYLVIGVNNSGEISASAMTQQLADLFDEAKLRSKLKRYLAEPFTVHTAVHKIDDSIVVLVYVGPSNHGWCIFAANGDYEDSTKKNQKVTVFRKGDVFVRHGSASERWQDSDRARLVGQIVERHKEAWRVELRHELAALGQGELTANNLVRLPSSAATWELDADGFDQLITELIRRNDDIPLRQLLMKVPADAARILREPDELSTLLDRITSIGGLALQFERSEWFDRVLSSFVSIYNLGFDSSGYDKQQPEIVALWLSVVAHVYSLGSLAVRLNDWASVRALADRRPRGETFVADYGSWLRHALTMASRANMLDRDESAGLIARAHNVVRSVSATHPDSSADDDSILNSLCQFDALGCLVVIGERRSLDSGNYYPTFSRYYMQRTAPAFVNIVTDNQMRATLFDGDDQFLADSIVELLDRANKESFRFGRWHRTPAGPVSEFIARHRTA